MKKVLLATVVATAFLGGCASVPMANKADSNIAKEFKAPMDNKAGVYVYRVETPVGAALKKDVWIDGECIGETASGMFFYHEVDGGKEYAISTESEFSPNELMIAMDSGELYFFEQYLKMGVFVGGAGLEQVDIETGKEQVLKLELATKGKCSTK